MTQVPPIPPLMVRRVISDLSSELFGEGQAASLKFWIFAAGLALSSRQNEKNLHVEADCSPCSSDNDTWHYNDGIDSFGLFNCFSPRNATLRRISGGKGPRQNYS
jgi:hypothetical protein